MEQLPLAKSTSLKSTEKWHCQHFLANRKGAGHWESPSATFVPAIAYCDGHIRVPDSDSDSNSASPDF